MALGNPASAQNLVAYLDAEPGAEDAASSPQEEVEAFLSARDFSFEMLEGAADTDALPALPVVDPTTAEVNAREGVRLAKAGQFEQAVPLFRIAVRLDEAMFHEVIKLHQLHGLVRLVAPGLHVLQHPQHTGGVNAA